MARKLDEEQLISFGKYLKELRDSEKLSQEVAAQKAGISTQGHISLLERGKMNPNRKTLKKLAYAYNVSLDEMLVRAGYEAGDTNTVAIRSEEPNRQIENVEGDAEAPVETDNTLLPPERIAWAIECIERDPSYSIQITDKGGNGNETMQAITIRVYQEATGRQLLKAEEMALLTKMIHISLAPVTSISKEKDE